MLRILILDTDIYSTITASARRRKGNQQARQTQYDCSSGFQYEVASLGCISSGMAARLLVNRLFHSLLFPNAHSACTPSTCMWLHQIFSFRQKYMRSTKFISFHKEISSIITIVTTQFEQLASPEQYKFSIVGDHRLMITLLTLFQNHFKWFKYMTLLTFRYDV